MNTEIITRFVGFVTIAIALIFFVLALTQVETHGDYMLSSLGGLFAGALLLGFSRNLTLLRQINQRLTPTNSTYQEGVSLPVYPLSEPPSPNIQEVTDAIHLTGKEAGKGIDFRKPFAGLNFSLPVLPEPKVDIPPLLLRDREQWATEQSQRIASQQRHILGTIYAKIRELLLQYKKHSAATGKSNHAQLEQLQQELLSTREELIKTRNELHKYKNAYSKLVTKVKDLTQGINTKM